MKLLCEVIFMVMAKLSIQLFAPCCQRTAAILCPIQIKYLSLSFCFSTFEKGHNQKWQLARPSASQGVGRFASDAATLLRPPGGAPHSTAKCLLKWSFWRSTAKRFIPVESTCFTVSNPYTWRTLRLLNSGFMAQKCICAMIDLGPPFLYFCQHSNFAPFSFRVLRTIQ